MKQSLYLLFFLILMLFFLGCTSLPYHAASACDDTCALSEDFNQEFYSNWEIKKSSIKNEYFCYCLDKNAVALGFYPLSYKPENDEYVSCGDGYCSESFESCVICPNDCGSCFDDLKDSLKQSVVLVKSTEYMDTDSELYVEISSSGSGVIIESDESHISILTNRHVVDCLYSQDCVAKWEGDVEVRLPNKKFYDVDRISYDSNLVDLAKLDIFGDFSDFYSVSMSSNLPIVGDEVLVLGYPTYNVESPQSVLVQSNSEGVILSVDDILFSSGYEYQAIVSDAFTDAGSSGGGWFDTRGDLIGVSTWGINEIGYDGESTAILLNGSFSWSDCKIGYYLTLDGSCERFIGDEYVYFCLIDSNDNFYAGYDGSVHYGTFHDILDENGCFFVERDLIHDGILEVNLDLWNFFRIYEWDIIQSEVNSSVYFLEI